MVNRRKSIPKELRTTTQGEKQPWVRVAQGSNPEGVACRRSHHANLSKTKTLSINQINGKGMMIPNTP